MIYFSDLPDIDAANLPTGTVIAGFMVVLLKISETTWKDSYGRHHGNQHVTRDIIPCEDAQLLRVGYGMRSKVEPE